MLTLVTVLLVEDRLVLRLQEHGETKNWWVEELLARPRPEALYVAAQAVAWAGENLMRVDTEYRAWRAQHTCNAIDRGGKTATIRAVIESSDQFKSHKDRLARAARLKRVSQGLCDVLAIEPEYRVEVRDD